MSSIEQLAFSIREEKHGVHVLLWDEQADLVRSLVVLQAALNNIPITYYLVTNNDDDLDNLRKIIETRSPIQIDEEQTTQASNYWIFFLQHASSIFVGPWLNGWRYPISDAPGTLLIIRYADYDNFQRHAPDLTSFVGSRVYDCSTMLSIFSKEIYSELSAKLPAEVIEILGRLPGIRPTIAEIEMWITENPADN